MTRKRLENKYINPPKITTLKPLAIAVMLASVSLCQANTFTVSNTLDTGSGSLRRAVFDANASVGDDTIVFAPGLEYKMINLTSGEIIIGSASNTDSLTITGPIESTPNSIVINATGSSRIFNALAAVNNNATFTLENVTLTGGNAATSGGAITVDRMGLTLNNSVITGNTSLSGGGGIYTDYSEVVINQSMLSGNIVSSHGGGISSRRQNLTFNESTVIGNQGSSSAGILFTPGSLSTLALNQSTVSNNLGSGIVTNATSGNLILNQSTISGNSSRGISSAAISIIVNQTTITNNSNIGLRSTNWGSTRTITLTNSILSNNQDLASGEGNFHTTFPNGSNGVTLLNINHSLFGDDVTEITGTKTGHYLSDIPDLGSLQSNGGIIQTHRPNINSPAVNSGSDVDATELFDQRGSGFARIEGTVDMGAVERRAVINGGDNEVIKRGEMAKALLQAKGVTPPLFATGLEYHDVQAFDSNANWIVAFAEAYSDGGCEDGRFCADSVVTREEMAKLFLKVHLGSGYQAPTAQGPIFNDVTGLSAFNINWINHLHDKGFTTGCGKNINGLLLFCPKAPVTRGWFNSLLTGI